MNRVLLLILIFGTSCAVALRDNENNKFDSLKPLESEKKAKEQFQSLKLSADELEAFDQRAAMSVNELISLTRILYDTTQQETFRNSARDRSVKYFDNTATVYIGGKKMSFETYLNKIEDGKILPLNEVVVTVHTGFENEGDKYENTVSITGLQDQALGKVANILVKNPKSFGTDTLEIWEIRILKMELR